MATTESRIAIVDINQLSAADAATAVNAAIETLETSSFVVREMKNQQLGTKQDPKDFVTILGILAEHLDSSGVLAKFASVVNGEGASLVYIEDPLGKITATDVEGALVENRTALDVAEANIAILRPGIPMQSRLRMLGAPAAIVAADYLTIGADIYEFRADTPPTGGTAGRVWLYNGANSAASRATLIKAINGDVDAALIANEVATELMLAAAGVTTGDVVVQSADAIGGSPAPSATATATTDNLTTATDIWDHTAMQYGEAVVPAQAACVTVTLGAEEMAKADMQVYFDFTPTKCFVGNRSRQQDEAYTISGNAVSLTLAGGGSPNNQSGDVLDFSAWE